jgi:endonuclease G
VSTPNSLQLAQARGARNQAAALHLYNPNVTLIDVGWRICEQERAVEPTLTVRVHLRYKPRGAAFESFAATSPLAIHKGQLEDAIEFPVDIVQATYRRQPGGARPSLAERASLCNPLRGGVSISNAWAFGEYGTCGGMVRDRATGRAMLLSCWHVLAGVANPPAGLPIYQPGLGDGGWSQNTIARFRRHGMLRGVDAAVAELTDARPMLNEQVGLGAVRGVAAPRIDMHVVKCGRSSGITEGIISGLSGEYPTTYGGFSAKIQHVVHIRPLRFGDEVSRGGDSGSWWLDKATNQVVGLHFAGDDEPEYALAIAMPQVLEALQVDLP